MTSKTIGAAVVLAMTLATGCQKSAGPASTTADGSLHSSAASAAAAPSGTETPEASIRGAIQEHLTHQPNLNLQSFDTEVKQVNIQGDRAQAQVEFHIKGGPGMMQMTYALEKHDNAWSVVNSEPAGNATDAGAPVDPMSDPTKFFKSAAPARPASHP